MEIPDTTLEAHGFAISAAAVALREKRYDAWRSALELALAIGEDGFDVLDGAAEREAEAKPKAVA